jgi:hypothetical protein
LSAVPTIPARRKTDTSYASWDPSSGHTSAQ